MLPQVRLAEVLPSTSNWCHGLLTMCSITCSILDALILAAQTSAGRGCTTSASSARTSRSHGSSMRACSVRSPNQLVSSASTIV